MQINFLAGVKIIKYLIQSELIFQGMIAVTGSMATLFPGGLELGAYSASKYAITAFVGILRQELKKSSLPIHLSIGHPYATKTQMFQGYKTKLDAFLWILDPSFVGKNLIKGFLSGQE